MDKAAAPNPNSEAGETEIDRRAVISWCLFDFANQPFSTLIITFIYAAFFAKLMCSEPGMTKEDIEEWGASYWSWGMAVSAICIAVLSPILGAVADKRGYRKLFLLISTVLCILASLALFFPMPGQYLLALVIVVLGNTAFEMASVFYNAFLPDLATDKTIGKISGIGWAVGYVGGLLATGMALFLLMGEENLLGLDRESYSHLRASGPLVALWFTVFSLPMFFFVKEDKSQVVDDGEPILRATFRQLRSTYTEIRKYRQILLLLLARLIYNDGLLLIFSFGGIYAQGVFNFSSEELLQFGLLLQITAAVGSFGLGFLDDRLGSKTTLLLTLSAMTLVTGVTLLAESATVFWVTGAVIGLFVGPNQSSSRALMGRFVPPDKENEFFGFFAFSGKATAFLGPALLGVLNQIYGLEVGFVLVIVFFIVGGALLTLVDEQEGILKANRSGPSNS